MIVDIKNLKMVMAEKTDLPDRVKNETTGAWDKTGKVTEKTTYTFKDILLEKLVVLGDNKYRDLEGKEVNIQLDIKYNDFGRKISVSLKNVTAA